MRYVVWIAEHVNHRIFERKWRSWAILRACLFECPQKPLAFPFFFLGEIFGLCGDWVFFFSLRKGRITRRRVLAGSERRKELIFFLSTRPVRLNVPLLFSTIGVLSLTRTWKKWLHFFLFFSFHSTVPFSSRTWEVTTFQGWRSNGSGLKPRGWAYREEKSWESYRIESNTPVF